MCPDKVIKEVRLEDPDTPYHSKFYRKVCLGSLPRKGDWLACATYHGMPVCEHLGGGSGSNSVDTHSFLTLKGMMASLC